MSRQAFDHIRAVAADLSPALLAEIERIGVIELPAPRHPTVAVHLYIAIVNQQLSAKAADTIWGRVVAVAERRGCAPADLFVDALADEVKACGLSRNKVRALAAVREAESRGELDQGQLRALPHAERVIVLCRIWGIGRWSADMIGLSHFCEPDIWPDGDVAAAGTLRRLLNRTDTVKAAEAFAPYRSILARYMWRIRDTPVI